MHELLKNNLSQKITSRQLKAHQCVGTLERLFSFAILERFKTEVTFFLRKIKLLASTQGPFIN